MKKILFTVTLLTSFSGLFAQDDYLKDYVIVYFHDDALDKNLLASDSRSFNKTSLILSKSLRDSLDKWNTSNTLKKVVRHARPDKLVSLSRTGEEVSIPKFYNLMYVAIPETENALEFCKKLETLPFVIYAEPDYIMKIDDAPAPNDTHFNEQRGWEQANDRDIDLLRAWDFTRGNILPLEIL